MHTSRLGGRYSPRGPGLSIAVLAPDSCAQVMCADADMRGNRFSPFFPLTLGIELILQAKRKEKKKEFLASVVNHLFLIPSKVAHLL